MHPHVPADGATVVINVSVFAGVFEQTALPLALGADAMWHFRAGVVSLQSAAVSPCRVGASAAAHPRTLSTPLTFLNAICGRLIAALRRPFKVLLVSRVFLGLTLSRSLLLSTMFLPALLIYHACNRCNLDSQSVTARLNYGNVCTLQRDRHFVVVRRQYRCYPARRPAVR